MPVTAIARLLKDRIGMDPASIGLSAIEHSMKERMLACGLDNGHAYFELVKKSERELQSLVDAVVVPETWFFRDPGAFDALASMARDEWAASTPNVRHLLSVPSSTGEEPYSMAMALLDAGFPASRFRVDAIDVSTRSLARAANAVYGNNSFRGSGITCRDRHFQPTADGYRLSDTIRRQVTFHQRNLIDPALTLDSSPYDVVFCRNLLIYFDRPTQDRAIATLGKLLKETGLLFVGAAESGVFQNLGFTSARLPMAFAFRKSVAVPQAPKPKVVSRVPKRVKVEAPAARPAPRPNAAHDSDEGVWRLVGNPPAESLSYVDEAAELANQGHFVEAAARCEQHLRELGPSAAAFRLLGLVRDASGNPAEAAVYYRKALYLEPGHQETVVHLALLMDKQGQTSEAQVLWNRARRLGQQAST